MKKLILLLFVILFGVAQAVNTKRVYLIDISGSMTGEGSIPTKDVFEASKTELINAILSMNDSTDIVIIPFAENIKNSIVGNTSNKDYLINKIKEIEILGNRTNIILAYSAALKEIDTSRNTEVYFITDGFHNATPDTNILFSKLNEYPNSVEAQKCTLYYYLTDNKYRQMTICNIFDKNSSMELIESLLINNESDSAIVVVQKDSTNVSTCSTDGSTDNCWFCSNLWKILLLILLILLALVAIYLFCKYIAPIGAPKITINPTVVRPKEDYTIQLNAFGEKQNGNIDLSKKDELPQNDKESTEGSKKETLEIPDTKSEVMKNHSEVPSVEEFQEMVKNGKEIDINELREKRPDIADNIDKTKERLGNNEYAKSIQIFEVGEDKYVICGHDDRTNQRSNYALVDGKDVYCPTGNANGDGHLNEFINNRKEGHIPNARYHTENVTFKTDSLGRTTDTYEHHHTDRLTNRNEKRGELKSVATEMGGGDNTVGGHLVAHNVDGPTEAINIVPMDEKFNNSQEWKSMENSILVAYQNHIESSVHKHIDYDGDSRVPSHIDVQISIGDQHKEYSFDKIN